MRRFQFGSSVIGVGLLVAGAAVAAVLAAPKASGGVALKGMPGAACVSVGRSLDTYASPSTYDDPIGDSGAAPDFCAAEMVTNDNETITIGIHAHNRLGIESGDSYGVLLDTDRNPATGDPTGADYEISLTAAGAALTQWDGTAFGLVPGAQVSMTWKDGYGPVLELRRDAIGNPEGFNFVLVSSNGADGDRAPDMGTWSYTLTALTLSALPLSLGPARAGHPVTARMLVIRNDLDVPLTDGTIACKATLSGRRLPGRASFTRDRVTCVWRLPTTARGQKFAGTVTVLFQGAQASKRFLTRVR